jgi:hypothetical protein
MKVIELNLYRHLRKCNSGVKYQTLIIKQRLYSKIDIDMAMAVLSCTNSKS